MLDKESALSSRGSRVLKGESRYPSGLPLKVNPFPIIIVAPSGTGKTTICKNILGKLPNIKYSISATTRKPRKGETDGKDYYFLSTHQFQKWIEENKFCEWAEVYDELYGTPKEPLARYISEGHHVLLAIDIQGAKDIKLKYPGAVSVFLLPPSIYELENRLVKRSRDSGLCGSGDPHLPDEINKRLESTKLELSYLKEFDYIVVNEEVSATAKKVIAIITAEECKSSSL